MLQNVNVRDVRAQKKVVNAKQNIYSPNKFYLTFPHDES